MGQNLFTVVEDLGLYQKALIKKTNADFTKYTVSAMHVDSNLLNIQSPPNV